MTADPLPATLDVLRRRLQLDGDLVAVWLFGSAARDEMRADSDVDLAFLARRRLDPVAVFDAAQDLAIALGRDVDLVDLAQAPTVLRAQVVGRGRRLFASDATAADSFEMYTLSDYARLNEERREVLARFEGRAITDDVVPNGVAMIGRSLNRVRDEFRGDPTRLDDQTVQDSVVLNLQRACEASIALAMHFVSTERLGMPQESRDAFRMLEAAGIVKAELSLQLQRMVGFRNIVVHAYQQLSRPILLAIVQTRLGDFEEFARIAVVRQR